MTINHYKQHFIKKLVGKYPNEEIHSFFDILLKEYLKSSRLELALDPTRVIKEDQYKSMEEALQRLLTHEPIQYILNHTNFFGLDLEVDTNVLIPRPETEELVQWVLDDYKPSEELTILDIGTGSGCIAISLAKNLERAEIFGIDISEGALAIAKRNALKHGVFVEFQVKNILKVKKLDQKYDIIVSNPPYVRELEKELMQRNVLEYEPASALYVKDEDPLLFYKKISELAAVNLTSGGRIYFEINQYLGSQTVSLLKEKNFKTDLKKDIFGVDRMLRGIKL